MLVVGGDDVALAAAEALAAHETLLFESVSLAAPAGGVYPGGFPACSAYASSAGGSASGHAGLAKLALGLDRVAYHEADLEAIVLNDGKQSENALLENADENADEARRALFRLVSRSAFAFVRALHRRRRVPVRRPGALRAPGTRPAGRSWGTTRTRTRRCGTCRWSASRTFCRLCAACRKRIGARSPTGASAY